MKISIPTAAAAAAMLPGAALAQEAAVSFDQKVNDVFAGSTGWFVNLILHRCPALRSHGSCCGWLSAHQSLRFISALFRYAPSGTRSA